MLKIRNIKAEICIVTILSWHYLINLCSVNHKIIKKNECYNHEWSHWHILPSWNPRAKWHQPQKIRSTEQTPISICRNVVAMQILAIIQMLGEQKVNLNVMFRRLGVQDLGSVQVLHHQVRGMGLKWWWWCFLWYFCSCWGQTKSQIDWGWFYS